VLLGQNCAGALSTPMTKAVIDDVADRLVEAIDAVASRSE
jgi:hypothetical protein